MNNRSKKKTIALLETGADTLRENQADPAAPEGA